MEKTIYVDNRPIRLKSHAAIPIQYRNQFGTDFFRDVFKLAIGFGEKEDWKELSIDDVDKVDFDVFYKIFWLFAKAGDKSIPPLEEWLEEFESFPLDKIMPTLSLMLSAMLDQKKRKKPYPKKSHPKTI